MAAQQTPPGWYTNPYGQLQWWDGYAWGQLAQQPPQPPPGPPAPSAGSVASAPNPGSAGSATSAPPDKALPNVSGFVWGALGLAVIALVAELIALLPLFGVGWQLELDEFGNLPSGGMTQALPTVPLWLPVMLAAGGVALAIIGLRRSAKKRAGVVVLIVVGFAAVAPVVVPPLLVILGFALYASVGIGTELSGGTPLG